MRWDRTNRHNWRMVDGETSLQRACRIEQERDAERRKILLIMSEIRCTRDDYAPDQPPPAVEDLLVNIEMILGAKV